MTSAQRRTHIVKNYDELTAETGVRINFRPKRHEAADVFGSKKPTLRINNTPFTLANISLSGIAFLSTTGTPFTVGETHTFTLEHENTSPLFTATGRIVRQEQTGNSVKIALTTDATIIELATITAAHRKVLLLQKLNGILESDQNLVAPEYKVFCAEISLWMRQLKTVLDEYETDTPNALSDTALIATIQDALTARWPDITKRANALINPILQDKTRLKAYKTYTEAMLTPDFLESRIAHHAYTKPFGYPGDYEMMRHLYIKGVAEPTVYSAVIQLFSHLLGAHVPHRIQQATHLLLHSLQHHPQARILTVGSGVGYEIAEVLKKTTLPACHLTLVEQDPKTLEQASTLLTPLAKRHPNTHLSFLHLSFLEMISTLDKWPSLPPQHLIYSLGVLDYLNDTRAALFIQRLYNRLEHGGTLVVSNLADTPLKPQWGLSLVLDWNMVYRTPEQMHALVANLGAENVTITTDASGQEYYLSVEKG